MNEENSFANLLEDILRLIDIGSRKTYNKSFQELISLSSKAGLSMDKESLVALSVVGALEERKALAKAAEENQSH
jgi:hypothetical protein